MKYYNIELNKADADALSVFLKSNNIKYERSGVGSLSHFEILLDSSGADAVNSFLDTL